MTETISTPPVLPSFWAATHGKKKNKKKISPLDEVSLLRRKQYHCLNKVTSFPCTHIILCQEAQLLYVHLEVTPLYHSPPPLFPYSSPPPPSTVFALIFLAFVHLHCFTPPHLFNLLLNQVSTTVLALYLKYSALFHCKSPRNYWISASCILTHFVSQIFAFLKFSRCLRGLSEHFSPDIRSLWMHSKVSLILFSSISFMFQNYYLVSLKTQYTLYMRKYFTSIPKNSCYCYYSRQWTR